MKKRFIACIIACAMLLIGTGYAYWTDQFTLKATVDTGNFEVALTAAQASERFTDFYNPLKNDLTPDYSSSGGAVLTSIDSTTGSHEVEFQLLDMYPGYGQKFVFKADNLGTVAAKLSNITVSHEGWGAELEKAIGINIQARINNRSYTWVKNRWVEGLSLNDIIVSEPDILDAIFGKVDFTIDGIPFVNLENLSKINADSNDFLLLDVEKSGDYKKTHEVEIIVRIAMDPDSEGEFTSGKTWNRGYAGNGADVNTENQNKILTLTFNWDQYNAH